MTFMVFPYLAGELADVATGTSKLGLDLNQIGLILIGILILQGVMSYLRVIWFAVVVSVAHAIVLDNSELRLSTQSAQRHLLCLRASFQVV